MKALVTGAGGFLGRAIVERLLARGDEVRGLARGDYPELVALGVEMIRADLADEEAITRASDQCDVVFHVAAKAGVWGRYKSYYDPNVHGAEHVIHACRRTGVPRLVYTSSPSVVFSGGDIAGADESIPYPAHFHSNYSETKALAEQKVLAANDAALRTVALRPHLIWGPRDNHIVPRLVARAKSGRLVQVGDGTNRVDSTYIDNAADAHLLAADALDVKPEISGRAYFITNGEPRPLWELINSILAAAGLPPVRRKISRRLAHVLGFMCELGYITMGMSAEPPMTRFLAGELTTTHWFDISAARRDLGYVPCVPIDDGLRRLADWFRSVGSS